MPLRGRLGGPWWHEPLRLDSARRTASARAAFAVATYQQRSLSCERSSPQIFESSLVNHHDLPACRHGEPRGSIPKTNTEYLGQRHGGVIPLWIAPVQRVRIRATGISFTRFGGRFHTARTQLRMCATPDQSCAVSESLWRARQEFIRERLIGCSSRSRRRASSSGSCAAMATSMA